MTGPGPRRGLGHGGNQGAEGTGVSVDRSGEIVGSGRPVENQARFDQERLSPHIAFLSHGQWQSSLVEGQAGSLVI